jgi:hypothetical protein
MKIDEEPESEFDKELDRIQRRAELSRDCNIRLYEPEVRRLLEEMGYAYELRARRRFFWIILLQLAILGWLGFPLLSWFFPH